MKVEQAITNTEPAHIQRRLESTARVINGLVEFGNPTAGPLNMRGVWANLTTPGANTEFTINHNLGYIPTGIIIMSLDQAAIIYASRKNQWTTRQAFFKCSVASVSLQGFVT